MPRLVFFFLLLTCVKALYSQQLSPTVTSTAGGFYNNEFGMLSSTVGELAAIETYGNQYIILTQGFQQPVDMITGVTVTEISDFEFDLYPNPSNGSFKILMRSGYPSTIEIKILDILGRVAHLDQFVHDGDMTIHQIDIDPPQGIYFISLKVVPKNSNEPIGQYLQKINIIH